MLALADLAPGEDGMARGIALKPWGAAAIATSLGTIAVAAGCLISIAIPPARNSQIQQARTRSAGRDRPGAW
jgi:hypothetical protein